MSLFTPVGPINAFTHYALPNLTLSKRKPFGHPPDIATRLGVGPWAKLINGWFLWTLNSRLALWPSKSVRTFSTVRPLRHAFWMRVARKWFNVLDGDPAVPRQVTVLRLTVRVFRLPLRGGVRRPEGERLAA